MKLCLDYITRNGHTESSNYIIYFRDIHAFHCTIEFEGQTYIYYLFLEIENLNDNYCFTGIFNQNNMIHLSKVENLIHD